MEYCMSTQRSNKEVRKGENSSEKLDCEVIWWDRGTAGWIYHYNKDLCLWVWVWISTSVFLASEKHMGLDFRQLQRHLWGSEHHVWFQNANEIPYKQTISRNKPPISLCATVRLLLEGFQKWKDNILQPIGCLYFYKEKYSSGKYLNMNK